MAVAWRVGSKRYRYTGKERDEETGFQYDSARYYAPWLGRWTATDPLGMADGTNLCWYASGNPVIMIDPAGTVPLPPKEVRTLETRISVLKADLAASDHALESISQQEAQNSKIIIESQARQVKFKNISMLVAKEKVVEHQARLNKAALAQKYDAEVQTRNRVEASLIEAQAKMAAHHTAVAEARADAKLLRQAADEVEAIAPQAKYTTQELEAALQDAEAAAKGDPKATHDEFMRRIAELEARPPGSARPTPAPAPPPPEAPAPKASHVGTPAGPPRAGPPSGPHEVDVNLSELDEIEVDLSDLENPRPTGKAGRGTGGTKLGAGVVGGMGVLLNAGGLNFMYRHFEQLMHPPPRHSPYDYNHSKRLLQPWETRLPDDPI